MLSTLGSHAVDALIENHALVSSWPQYDQEELLRLAVLRDASVYETYVRYPELWSGRKPPEAPSTTVARQLPTDILPQSTTQHDGTLSALVTAPHGGYLRAIGGRHLVQKPSKKPDGATLEIASDLHTFLQAAGRPQPTVLIDNIQRACRTYETRSYFEMRTYQALGYMAMNASTRPIVHLDLHGYTARDQARNYDLRLGTGHRQTVGEYDTDALLAEFMESRGYSVYLPTEIPNDDERYTASSPATLVQRVRSLGVACVSSIQIEISKNFRTLETIERGQQLARDLGEFCLLVG